jgi:hypothetical protein
MLVILSYGVLLVEILSPYYAMTVVDTKFYFS